MNKGPNTGTWRKSRSAAPQGVRSRSIAARPAHTSVQNARRAYERYLALARAETVAGNPVGAENYYQHAEHYFRSMPSTPEKETNE
jgi:hypothetical protein